MSAASPGRRTQAERVAEAERALLAAAVELIGEQGYGRTTAAQIGERAGYSRSIVRVRYGSKEALLTSWLAHAFERRLLSSRPEPASGLDRVLGQVDRLRVELAEEPASLRAFLVLSFESTTGIPELQAWMPDWLAQRHRQATDALITGQQDGSVRPDIDPVSEAEKFVSFGLGIAFTWIVEKDDKSFDADLLDWRETYRRRWETDSE